MRIFRVRVNPHNSLETLAQYHVSVVRDKLSSGNTDRIGLDCISAVIAMAFTVEAIMNFVGAKKVSEWKERTPFKNKVGVLEATLRFKFDDSMEPFKTLSLLKEARDRMAHGQPVEFEVQVESDRQVGKAMQPVWTSAATPEFVLEAYDQVNDFKRVLFKRARIKPGVSLTSASYFGSKT